MTELPVATTQTQSQTAVRQHTEHDLRSQAFLSTRLRWHVLLSLFLTGVNLANALSTGHWTWQVGTLMGILFMPVLAYAHHLNRTYQMTHAANLLSAAMMLTPLAGVWIFPEAVAFWLLFPLAATLFGLPYLSARGLRWSALVTILIAAAVLIFAVMQAGRPVPPNADLGWQLLIIVPSLIFILFGLYEQHTRMLAVVADERAIRERYEGIFNQAVEGIFQKTITGQYLTVNPALARIFGYANPTELITTVHDIGNQIYLCPDDRAQMLARVLAHGSVIGFEAKCRRKDDSVVWVSENVYPVYDATGRLLHFEGTVEDITALKQAQAARDTTAQRMAEMERLESLGLMARGVAHDINNLLNVISGNALLARQDTRVSSMTTESLGQIDVAVQQMTDLTRQLLDFAGRGTGTPQAINPVHLVERIQRLIRAVLRHDITPMFLLRMETPVVHADAAEMRQVMMNLVVNARDAISGRGEVRIRTGSIQLGSAEVAELQPLWEVVVGTYAYIEVEDTGSGMDETTRARIFEPFFTTKAGGHGLGLATVFGVVRRHNGAMMVTSMLGQGSVFRILLPVVLADTPTLFVLDAPRTHADSEIQRKAER